MSNGTSTLFANHPRRFRGNRYLYAVVSRRSRGLSIGLNLNPDASCNFDCVYCSVDRTRPAAGGDVDLRIVRHELDDLLDAVQDGSIWRVTPFQLAPQQMRRLNDVAFSGDGEPTGSPAYAEAARIVIDALAHRQLHDVKIVTITNSTLLHRPAVAETLDLLYRHNGEAWCKLDAGTQAYFEHINRCRTPLSQILKNIRDLGRRQPIVIQSMFIDHHGPPPESDLLAYLERLREMDHAGAKIRLVQIYTVARQSAEGSVKALSSKLLMTIAERVCAIGLEAEVYPAPD